MDGGRGCPCQKTDGTGGRWGRGDASTHGTMKTVGAAGGTQHTGRGGRGLLKNGVQALKRLEPRVGLFLI